jgi:hypothetical protein
MTLPRHVGLLARAASLSLLACSAPAKSGGLDPAELTSIEVTPTSVTMAPNTSQVFAAQGFWSDGSHGTVPVTWTVSGGSMAANGAYTASATPGTYVVRAVFQGGGYGDSALVTVDSSAAPPPPPPTPNLISLDVTPASATLSPGEKKTFAAVGQWSDSVARPVTIVWSSTGGTVSNSGSYTAGPTVGNFVVRAFASGTSIGDSATVEIRDSTSPPSPQLVALDVTPPSVTLDPGASRTFVAQGHWSDTVSRPVTVMWSSTGGTSHKRGLHRGSDCGSFVVRAIASGTTIGDSAAVVIRDTTSAPPIPATSAATPPPPTTLVQEGFEDTGFAARGRYDNTNLTITAADTGRAGTKSLEATFNQGIFDADLWQLDADSLHAHRECLSELLVKYSANWVGSGVSYHPHEFHFISPRMAQYIGPSAQPPHDLRRAQLPERWSAYPGDEGLP